jgi:hypothetical protein
VTLGRSDLVNQGIIQPGGRDWRVRLVFVDGTERVVRVSPGRLSEEDAINRAKRHAKIFDETVLDRVEAERAEKTTQVAGFGIVQK